MILDLSSKDQIISAFSEFDLDQDQDHQKWSRSWSYRSLDQIFQRTADDESERNVCCDNNQIVLTKILEMSGFKQNRKNMSGL